MRKLSKVSSFGGAAEATLYEGKHREELIWDYHLVVPGSRLPPPPDIPSLVLSERIIYVALPLVPKVAQLIVAQLLYLDYESIEKPIFMYINSAGEMQDTSGRKNAVTELLAVVDVMNYIKSPINTICVGQAHGVAAVLLANGRKGGRFALPHSSIMINQPEWGSHTVQASDFASGAREAGLLKKELVELLALRTGNSVSKVFEDTQRNKYMNATEAIAYGIIDNIISSSASNSSQVTP